MDAQQLLASGADAATVGLFVILWGHGQRIVRLESKVFK